MLHSRKCLYVGVCTSQIIRAAMPANTPCSDWFRLETMDDSFQPTIDLLLNVAVFAWFGAVCPWTSFIHNHGVMPIYRLIPLGILVLLFRRPPIVLGMHKWIQQIEEWRQAFFVGFFGPIGVSAIFYLYTAREFLEKMTVDGVQREDAALLEEQLTIVVWFMTVCSIIVHGLSVPLGKVGWHLPRTLSSLGSHSISRSSSNDPDEPDHAFRIGRAAINTSAIQVGPTEERPRQIFRIGGTVIKDPRSRSKSAKGSRSASGDREGISSGVQTPKDRRGDYEKRHEKNEEDTDRREDDLRAGQHGHEASVEAARLGRVPSADMTEQADRSSAYEATPPASPGAVNKSITWAALAGLGGDKSSYSRGGADKKEPKRKRSGLKGSINKRDIRVLGAKPMGKGNSMTGEDRETEGEGNSSLVRGGDATDAESVGEAEEGSGIGSRSRPATPVRQIKFAGDDRGSA